MPAPGSSLSEHLRRHLAALDAAGVRFVPKAGPPPPLPVFAEPVPEAPPVDHTRVALDQLAAEVARCEKCPALFATRSGTVFGGGPVGAEVCFLADAPREGDDLFPGEVGELMNKMLTAMGFGREEVYLCAVLKCRPPGNRPPRPDECANCRVYLERQLELARPGAVCCLGGGAAQTLLNTTEPIQQLRGTVQVYRGLPVVCTYHPEYVQKNPKVKAACWDDLKLLLKVIGKPLPGK
jgi:DNA polymerase